MGFSSCFLDKIIIISFVGRLEDKKKKNSVQNEEYIIFDW
jgi:hypothetical protein